MRCYHSGFTVTKKVFQRCLNSYKKVVSTVKKEVFSRCIYNEMFHLSFHGGVSTVKTNQRKLRVSRECSLVQRVSKTIVLLSTK